MAEAPKYSGFYCPRLKPGVKFEAKKLALAINNRMKYLPDNNVYKAI
jgi:hypothetical protein